MQAAPPGRSGEGRTHILAYFLIQLSSLVKRMFTAPPLFRKQGEGLEGNLPSPARTVEHVSGEAEARDVSPEPLHDLHARPDLGPEVVRSLDRIALEQVVGTDRDALQAVDEVTHRFVV